MVPSAVKLLKAQPNRQIGPMRIGFVDQIDFLLAAPVFPLFFAQDSVLHATEQFEMYQMMDTVTLRKTGYRTASMLLQSGNQIRSHADIESTIMAARKDIGAGLLLFRHMIQFDRKWMLKQVQHDEVY